MAPTIVLTKTGDNGKVAMTWCNSTEKMLILSQRAGFRIIWKESIPISHTKLVFFNFVGVESPSARICNTYVHQKETFSIEVDINTNEWITWVRREKCILATKVNMRNPKMQGRYPKIQFFFFPMNSVRTHSKNLPTSAFCTDLKSQATLKNCPQRSLNFYSPPLS